MPAIAGETLKRLTVTALFLKMCHRSVADGGHQKINVSNFSELFLGKLQLRHSGELNSFQLGRRTELGSIRRC